MKVWVNGGKAITLTKRNFVAQGGQASVYARQGTAFKIYHDPTEMIPATKIVELASISDPRVIRPEQIVNDKDGIPVGYTMRHLANSYALCQLFPRAFRDRHSLKENQILALVEQLREGIETIHRANVLLVDGNEMNFLVSQDFRELYFVDVDSYQTPSYPATAIMESIRDRHAVANSFGEATDWFSFAVVAFQMFVGIHPYKGKHPRCKGLDARMQANLSVFDAEVRVPRAAYPLDAIPQAYRQWFEAVFASGLRGSPPQDTQAASHSVVPHEPQLRSTQLHFDLLHTYPTSLRGYWSKGHRQVVATTDALWIDQRRVATIPNGFIGVAFANDGTPVSVAQDHGGLSLWDLENNTHLPFTMHVSQAVIGGDRIYAVSGQRLLELQLSPMTGGLVVSASAVGQVLEHATQLFSAVAIQNLLGRYYASLLPTRGRSYQVPIPELDGAKILEAQLRGRVLMVSVHHSGSLHRYVFRFSQDYSSYDCRHVADVDVATLNFAVLDSGICVALTEDDALEVFHSATKVAHVDRIVDTTLGTDMRMQSRGGKLLVLSGNSLLHMAMK